MAHEFDREARRVYWRDVWDEPLTEAEIEAVVNSEQIDHVLYEIEGLIGSMDGHKLASALGMAEQLRVSLADLVASTG